MMYTSSRWVRATVLATGVFLPTSAAASRAPDPPWEFVILLDLSQSVSRVCTEYIEGVPRLIVSLSQQLPPERSARLTILPITQLSYGEKPLMEVEVPADPGRYQARRSAAVAVALAGWDEIAGGILCDEPFTDVLGAIELAELHLSPSAGQRWLIAFTDGRHDAGVVDLDRSTDFEPANALRLVAAADRIPDLSARVCFLGVQTKGKTAAYHRQLRAFWAQYFQLAGSVLEEDDFTPRLSCDIGRTP